MRSALMGAAFAVSLCVAAGPAFAQAGVSGVCDRETTAAKQKVLEEHKRWEEAITNGNFPPPVRDSYLVIVGYSRDSALHAADAKNIECTNKYGGSQAIMDATIAVFSNGLSLIAPGKTAYVDVSEILNGYPLGGPNALIPKLREQVLGGDNGTVANIIRDPWKCISFQRKC